jgi:hypothetical protein
MEEIWGICIEQCDTLKALFPVLLQTSFSSSDHLKQLRLAFSHAVHGYITLLDIDWEDMFRCRCVFEDDAKGTVVYDNACNTVCFAEYRDARVFDKYASNLIDQKNIRVRALKALISSEVILRTIGQSCHVSAGRNAFPYPRHRDLANA